MAGFVAACATVPVVRTSMAATVKTPLPRPNLDFLRDAVTFMPREAWTGIAPRPWQLRSANGFDRLTVHHQGTTVSEDTHTNAIRQDIENILAGHRSRHYGDIGYHFIVDRAGRVWEGRSLAYEGAHVSGNNEHNIGVMLLGNFEVQAVSAAQRESLTVVVNLLRAQFEIKKHRLYGHRDLCASVCPGQHLYPFVLSIRNQGVGL
jgi:hypothetical protein